MALKPPRIFERKDKSPNPYARYRFHDTSTCGTRDVGLDPLTSSASSYDSARSSRTREEYQSARSRPASDESAEYYTAPAWQSPRNATQAIGKPMASTTRRHATTENAAAAVDSQLALATAITQAMSQAVSQSLQPLLASKEAKNNPISTRLKRMAWSIPV